MHVYGGIELNKLGQCIEWDCCVLNHEDKVFLEGVPVRWDVSEFQLYIVDALYQIFCTEYAFIVSLQDQ